MTLLLHNCGDKPYTVRGYPALRLLDADGQPVDVQVINDIAAITRVNTGLTEVAQQVTAAPGEYLRTGVAWRNTVLGDSPPSVNVHLLEITPAPGDASHQVTPDYRLDLGNTGRLAVGPWQAAPEYNWAVSSVRPEASVRLG
jgi:hypothetical protein